MKIFIWSSEYIAHIAVAETKEEAISKLKADRTTSKGSKATDSDLDYAFKDEPVIVDHNGSIHLDHSNE